MRSTVMRIMAKKASLLAAIFVPVLFVVAFHVLQQRSLNEEVYNFITEY